MHDDRLVHLGEVKARAAGCDSYVTKPYSPKQLLALVQKMLTMP